MSNDPKFTEVSILDHDVAQSDDEKDEKKDEKKDAEKDAEKDEDKGAEKKQEEEEEPNELASSPEQEAVGVSSYLKRLKNKGRL